MSGIKGIMLPFLTLVLLSTAYADEEGKGQMKMPPKGRPPLPIIKGKPPVVPKPCDQGNPCDAAYCARYPNLLCRPSKVDGCKAEFYYHKRDEVRVILDCKDDGGCSEACPRVYFPQCGTDGVTYGNMCTLNAAKCISKGKIRLQKEGECDDQ